MAAQSEGQRALAGFSLHSNTCGVRGYKRWMFIERDGDSPAIDTLDARKPLLRRFNARKTLSI